MTKNRSTLIEVCLKESILMFSRKKGRRMLFPPLFESFGLTNIDSLRVSIENLVNSRFERMLLVVEFHPAILQQRAGFVSAALVVGSGASAIEIQRFSQDAGVPESQGDSDVEVRIL